MRPWAIWEQFFPIKINFGRWKNLPCNYEFKIDNPTATGTIQTSHWAAATTLNAVIEHRELSLQEGVGVPLTSLHILLSRKRNANNGNTYMTNKILVSGGIIPYALLTNGVAVTLGLIPVAGSVLAPLVVSVAALWAVRAPDIVFGYGGSKENFLEDFNPNRDVTLDPNRWLAKGLFHELMDSGTEPFSITNVTDNVSGFTNAQFYNALTNNVSSLVEHRNLLLQQNGNSQQNSEIQLFNDYGH